MSENTDSFNARYHISGQRPTFGQGTAMTLMSRISPEQPVLIAGPTASGKSALALEIAESQGGVIVNADAIQVYDNWRVLTARPSIHDETCAKHLLYGHIPYDAEYSVGHWLRDVSGILAQDLRPIIVGGTGLYFTALTQGLADIPATPADLRTHANARVAAEGYQALLAELDAETKARIDIQNPMRVQRAWEVLTATGRPLAVWQDETPPPMLPVKTCVPVLFDVDKEWLNARIARRFAQMIKLGALEETRSNLAHWNPALLSSKAIGAPELMGYLQGACTLEDAQEKATVATRQFAKRQRTWFRSKMKNWHKFHPEP